MAFSTDERKGLIITIYRTHGVPPTGRPNPSNNLVVYKLFDG
jgi:hypothetical protein